MRRPTAFIPAALLDAFGGGWRYRSWLAVLTFFTLAGVGAYGIQLRDGLYATNMTDQVSWGIYIASFTFQVGVAAAAVMVVIPAYAYGMKSFQRIVFVGEALALSAVLTALLYVTVDLGRPERAWHLIPWWGALNFPTSMLSWDVVVLQGYLVINSVLITLALWSKFHGRAPPSRIYTPLIFISMAWAISVLMEEAFLYTSLGARPYWNSAIIAPRFMASAFIAGPAFLVIALRVVRRFTNFIVHDEVFTTFRGIMAVTLLVNLCLFAAEVFTELFGGALHAASLRYLLFGHGEHVGLRLWAWGGISLSVIATLILLSGLGRRPRFFDAACVAAFVGIWIEKGMALVVPGFVPTPLGEIVEYTPSMVEFAVSLGIFCFGLLLFSILVRLGIRVEMGDLRAPGAGHRPSSMPPPPVEAAS